jgi:hypothetical protein
MRKEKLGSEKRLRRFILGVESVEKLRSTLKVAD